MIRQPDIQYVSYSIDGTAARKLDNRRAPVAQSPKAQPAHRRRRKVIKIDPVSLCAMAVACMMLVVMVVGLVRLGDANREAEQMDRYVMKLQEENNQLQVQYEENYDLEDVRQKALAMGLVPKDVDHMRIPEAPVQMETKKTIWDEISNFLAGLFA